MKTNAPQGAGDSRLRIAFIARNFGSHFGGAEAYAENLLAELSAHHDIHVFCQQWAGTLKLPHTVLPRRRGVPRWLNLLLFTLQCRRLTLGFDIVHTHENSWLGNVHAVHVMPVRYARLYHRASWSRWLATWTSPRWLAYLAMEGMRYKAAPKRRLATVSPLLASQMKAAYPDCMIAAIIPPAVQAPGPGPTRWQARDQLGLPQEGRLAILVANDPLRKGFDALLHALPLMDSGVSVIVAGGEPHVAPHVRKLAQQAGMAQRVHVWPAQRDLAPFYKAADLCIFPTTGDSFGMVPLEAMSHGLPVVMSGPRHCGFAEFVRAGEEALILDNPDDVQAIARDVDRLMYDAHLYDRLSRAGIALADRMSWAHAASQYTQLYKAVQGDAPAIQPG